MKKDKTEYILFGTNQKAKEKSLERAYRDQSINKTTNYKYLGVKLDHTLLRKKHFNSKESIRSVISSQQTKKQT